MDEIISKEDARNIARREERALPWPKPNPDAPLIADPENRFLYYTNRHGKQVILPESLAVGFHDRMKEFHGDQNGNMTPPRRFKGVRFSKKYGKQYL